MIFSFVEAALQAVCPGWRVLLFLMELVVGLLLEPAAAVVAQIQQLTTTLRLLLTVEFSEAEAGLGIILALATEETVAGLAPLVIKLHGQSTPNTKVEMAW